MCSFQVMKMHLWKALLLALLTWTIVNILKFFYISFLGPALSYLRIKLSGLFWGCSEELHLWNFWDLATKNIIWSFRSIVAQLTTELQHQIQSGHRGSLCRPRGRWALLILQQEDLDPHASHPSCHTISQFCTAAWSPGYKKKKAFWKSSGAAVGILAAWELNLRHQK